MDTPQEIKQNAYAERRDANATRCERCGKTENETDLKVCGNVACDNHACACCATETEWELEACSDRCALNLLTGLQEMYRESLRRARKAA